MDSKAFYVLYNDRDFYRRVNGLAYRYFRAYPTKFEIFGWDQDDLEQELWIRVYENDSNKRDDIINALVYDLHDMLEATEAKVRAVDDVDPYLLAYENENGELETDDEVMARLVHSGKGRYIS
jgi:hypothetical protein